MSLESRIVWSEGMFLNPQHFQQHDRYIERYIDNRCAGFGSYAWGFQELEVDAQLLKLGKISLLRGKGVFPDGTPFSFPDIDEAPPVLDIPAGTHNQLVYLALPVRRPGAVDVLPKEDNQNIARYYSTELEVRDVTVEGGDTQTVTVGKLRLRLLLETEDLSGYTCVGVLRVAEARDDKDVVLDGNYLVSCVDCRAAAKLNGFVAELGGLLHHRAESIAGRLADVKRGGTAEIADYMLLQLINRVEPVVKHLSTVQGLHPLQLYAELLQLAGELSTFVAKGKRPPEFPRYQHDDLQQTFGPVMTILREFLSMVYEQTAISLALVEKKYGIRVSEINDRSLLGTANFVLAVRADVAEEVVRSRLPAQIKIGPVERIRQLVNAAMPGIAIRALPVAPRQIPFRSGYCYFELDKHSVYWKELHNSGGFAMHVGGDFPGLEMEFWAIRNT